MMTWPAYPIQKAVLLAFLAVSTVAGAHPKPIPTKYSSVHRALFLSNDPASKVPELYVAGQVVTILRFEQPCDRERTKMMGWEGRLEPVECVGKKVLIEPLKDLTSEDRLLLVVTLADGTELPFTVTANETRRDMQVDVYPDSESPEAVRVNLVRDKASLTGFKELDKTLLREEGVEILASTLVTTEKSKNRKVATVFQVTNKDPVRPWVTDSGLVSALNTGEPLPFVIRGWPASIGPGQTGYVALVADLSSFDPIKDGDKIAFELFRDGGRQQGFIVWEVKHLLP